jgi:hypothetical protein
VLVEAGRKNVVEVVRTASDGVTQTKYTIAVKLDGDVATTLHDHDSPAPIREQDATTQSIEEPLICGFSETNNPEAAQLSGLAISAGKLQPSFQPHITQYRVSLPSHAELLSVIPSILPEYKKKLMQRTVPVAVLCYGGGVGSLDTLYKAGLDEGLLSLSLHNLLYMENPYSYKKCQ